MSKEGGNDLFLFACNTGELYRDHLELARWSRGNGERVRFKRWRQHVKYRVIPLYRKQIADAPHFSTNSVSNAARRLDAYYARHLEESER